MTNPQADVATALRLIEDMASRLEARATDHTAGHGIVGGNAMVNLAGVGSRFAWMERINQAEEAGDYTLADHEDPDEFWPPYQIIRWWSQDYRQRLGMTNDDPRWKPSLLTEVKFLRNADVAAHIWGSEPHFDNYAKDVKRAQAKLEAILHEGDRSDRTAVVCDRCDDGRPLIRVWADARPTAWQCDACGERAEQHHELCPRCDQPAMRPLTWASDEVDDRWKCPGCRHRFDTVELGDARATHMRRREPKEWIPRPQAIDLLRSLGHQERVAIKLVDDPSTLGHCDLTTHVRWVHWPEVWRRERLLVQAKRLKAARSA